MGQVVPLAQKIREGLHLSFSQVKSYLTCPKRYFYHYVVGERPEFVSVALPFGKAVHRAAERMYKHMREHGEKPDFTEVAQAFKMAFNEELEASEAKAPVQMRNGDSIPELEKLGLSLVEVLYDRTEKKKILEVEFPFSISLPGRPEKFIGFFDLVEEDDDGTVVLVELKTSARRWSDSQLDWDLQSSGYAHALKALGVVDGHDPVVRHDILLKNPRKPDLERYATVKTETQRQLAVQTAVEVAASIDNAVQTGVFHRSPNPQNCPSCEYRARCISTL